MSFAYRGPRDGIRAGDGLTYGCVVVPGPHNRDLTIIFSDGLGWEHVSVSTPARPNWPEMCFVKDLFWSVDDVVMQLAEYVNNHPYCLHLWRPQGLAIPTPPPALVGTLGRADEAETRDEALRRHFATSDYEFPRGRP